MGILALPLTSIFLFVVWVMCFWKYFCDSGKEAIGLIIEYTVTVIFLTVIFVVIGIAINKYV